MHTPTFPASFAHPLAHLRTSFRLRSSSRSPSPARSTKSRRRISAASASTAASPIITIRSIISRQPSMVDLEEERRSFASGLAVLEPRPVVYWGGMEERMESF